MIQEIVELAVESLEDRFEDDVVGFKPSGEKEKFILGVAGNVFMVNAAENSFTPVKKGRPSDYMEMKDFFRDVGLEKQRIR